MAGIGTGNQFGTVSHGDTQRVATPLKYQYSPTVPTCLSVLFANKHTAMQYQFNDRVRMRNNALARLVAQPVRSK